jgi:type III restriction enzyme
MASSPLNPTILEPLFAPWAEPNAHRVRAEKAGDPAVMVPGHRALPKESPGGPALRGYGGHWETWRNR